MAQEPPGASSPGGAQQGPSQQGPSLAATTGAAGEGHVELDAGGDAASSPPITGSEAGAGSGSAPDPTSEAGSPAVADDPTVSRTPPTCSPALNGTYCGPHLSPAGDVNTRYFCSVGALVAEAVCPGVCDAASNSCKQGAGTGGGQGGANKPPWALCRVCWATQCTAALAACEGDAQCTAHLQCLRTCDASLECHTACSKAFVNEPLLAKLDACLDASSCSKLCKLL